MEKAKVLIEEVKGLGIRLVLNDPESLNAMGTDMAAEFSKTISAIRNRPELRYVIITGAGRAFSGGGHLDMLFEKTRLSQEKNRELMELFYQQFLSVQDLPVPVIAAINGHAIGAGLCLALAADIRIASAEAKLGLNFVRIGLHPGMGATYFVPRLVGPARAAELLYAGKIISAEEAERIGLINQAVSPETFEQTVASIAEGISSSGPIAVRQLKRNLRASLELSLDECLQREAQCQSINYSEPEFLEGITAAKEKRKPKF